MIPQTFAWICHKKQTHCISLNGTEVKKINRTLPEFKQLWRWSAGYISIPNYTAFIPCVNIPYDWWLSLIQNFTKMTKMNRTSPQFKQLCSIHRQSRSSVRPFLIIVRHKCPKISGDGRMDKTSDGWSVTAVMVGGPEVEEIIKIAHATLFVGMGKQSNSRWNNRRNWSPLPMTLTKTTTSN